MSLGQFYKISRSWGSSCAKIIASKMGSINERNIFFTHFHKICWKYWANFITYGLRGNATDRHYDQVTGKFSLFSEQCSLSSWGRPGRWRYKRWALPSHAMPIETVRTLTSTASLVNSTDHWTHFFFLTLHLTGEWETATYLMLWFKTNELFFIRVDIQEWFKKLFYAYWIQINFMYMFLMIPKTKKKTKNQKTKNESKVIMTGISVMNKLS